MARKGLLKHFKVAMAWVEQNEKDSLEHWREATPDDLTRDDFFAEYVHVVLVSGFNYRVVQALHPDLEGAFMDYDCDAIAKSPGKVRRDALLFFRNERKIDAIISTAVRLADSDWEEFKAELTGPSSLEFMETLGFVGPANSRFLARNLGLDYAKPDLWMLRVAGEFGYGESPDAVFRMVDTIQGATGERPGVIDYILWEYERRGRSRRI